MESKLIFSDKYLINNYSRLINLLSYKDKKTFSSIKTTVRLKLINKKFSLRLYKKLLRLNTFSNVLNSYFILLYCLVKKYFFVHFPWILSLPFNVRNLSFFIYHFLVLYKAIFLIKMILDWFPVKNWDRASPLKRFLRRVTIDWTKQFEKYFPSIFAWLIVINIIPIFLSLIETFYVSNDFNTFPTSYNFEELLEFVLESNLLTLKQKFI